MDKFRERGRWFLGLVFCIVCGLENVSASEDSSFIITDRGEPRATIIIGRKATQVEGFAASELQKYIQQIAGARLPIRKDSDKVEGNLILIGNKQNNIRIAQLGEKIKISPEYPGKEGFIIRVTGNNLILAGSDSNGTLYSIYDLLESIGCRWFFPQVAGWEIIPREKDISVSRRIERIEKPDFKNRETWQQLGMGHCDWLAKNKCNHLVIQWWQWNDSIYKTYLRDLKKRGIECEVGHDNTISWWLPADKYFDKHPEYYPLINGRRMGGKATQFCFSNSNAAEEVAKNMCKFIEKYPEVAVIGLGITDTSGGFCECERCKALHTEYMPEESTDHSGEYLFFANKVANIVAKSYPDKKIQVHAYEYGKTIDAPVNITAAKNLKLVFYLWVRDGARAINSIESSRNKYLSSELKKYLKIFGNGNVVAADYYYGMGPYGYHQEESPWWRGFIWPIFEVIAKDFPYFKQEGIQSVSIASGWQFSYLLNTYLFSRFAWEADANLDKLLDDFCTKSFETAAGPMRRYLDLLMKSMRSIDFSKTRGAFWRLKGYKNAYVPHRQNLPVLLNQKLLRELGTCLKEARGMAKANEGVLKRISLVEEEFKYSNYFIRIRDIKKSGDRFFKDQHYEKAVKTYTSALKLLNEAAATQCCKGLAKGLEGEIEIKAHLLLAKTLRNIDIKDKENIAQNPSAEKIEDGTVNKPIGWGCYQGDGSIRWSSTTDEAYSGKYSVFLEATC